MRRLYRSRTEAMIGGVCGGLGEYFGLDPTLVRLFFVFLGLAGGAGLLLYLLLWIIVPLAPGESAPGDVAEPPADGTAPAPERRTRFVLGLVMILLGGIFLLRNLCWYFWPWLGPRFFYRYLHSILPFFSRFIWPFLLIVAGLVLLLRRRKGE
ncbi:MAG: PspC domain-containing protein [Firmicutes bacterium]|nr:PspC domain-containing protein [Bacillota bacterium]